jgi:hypothetical protein
MGRQSDDTSDIENLISKYNFLTIFLTASAIIVAIISIVLIVHESLLFLLGFTPVTVIIVAISFCSAKRTKLKYLLQIRKDWGANQMDKKRDFKTTRPLFDYFFCKYATGSCTSPPVESTTISWLSRMTIFYLSLFY